MITSTSNQNIKNIVRLTKSARERKKQNCFLVEGPRMYFEVPEDRILSCYLTQDFEDRYKDRLTGRSYELISESVCRHLSDTRTPQGVIALVRRQEGNLSEILKQEASPCLFVLEDLQDPGNVGTIIRTAEGAGVHAVILSGESVDPYNPKVIRSTMGSIFRVPVFVAEDLHAALDMLKKESVRIYAAHLDGESFYMHDYTGPSAFLIGNEGNGLREDTARMADSLVRIPMKGRVESLNAATSATVLMYEMMRQREHLQM